MKWFLSKMEILGDEKWKKFGTFVCHVHMKFLSHLTTFVNLVLDAITLVIQQSLQS